MNRLAFRRELRRFAQRLANAQSEYPAASGTAREAPSVSSSGDTMRISDGAARFIQREVQQVEDSPAPLTQQGAATPDSDRPRSRHVGNVAKPHGDTEPARVVSPPAEAVDPAAVNRAFAAALAGRSRPPKPAIDQSRLPVAYSREGCARCGVRGDLGCEHQRAMGEA